MAVVGYGAVASIQIAELLFECSQPPSWNTRGPRRTPSPLESPPRGGGEHSNSGIAVRMVATALEVYEGAKTGLLVCRITAPGTEAARDALGGYEGAKTDPLVSRIAAPGQRRAFEQQNCCSNVRRRPFGDTITPHEDDGEGVHTAAAAAERTLPRLTEHLSSGYTARMLGDVSATSPPARGHGRTRVGTTTTTGGQVRHAVLSRAFEQRICAVRMLDGGPRRDGGVRWATTVSRGRV
ncbi:hypothetical protein HYPSUDRAFT_209358 [Hypholoma sublateritium FD-334 SS-4]|uniref:Uncharacterized protein n=1 Tax=Hypholoma sublateritium (strain FD-334 SS-4) TaxID=945553 RepID=A0A0D2KGM4_HYPSF|nr:hypothetical protein HYPSUDRAFT_209358 [Hypholoma sublateritium FD-334 SS-4]